MYNPTSRMYQGGFFITFCVPLEIIPHTKLTMNDGSILVCYLVKRLLDFRTVEITLFDGEVYRLPISDFKNVFEVNKASIPWW